MRSLHTRTQLQQTQFTKTKKYGLRVMVGLLISALVVGTGQMTAQPTHAFVPLIAKGTATAGAFLYVILNQQQHEKSRRKLEAQCGIPMNKNSPLCQPLKDITKPLPLADIQKWIKAQCKNDSACIEKLVQGIEISFTTFTKMPILLAPTLCTHPNFTLLAETLEQYCKKSGFLPSKFGTPKPGKKGGKNRVSSSANSNSGAGGSGDGKSVEDRTIKIKKLYDELHTALYGTKERLEKRIEYYTAGGYPEKSEIIKEPRERLQIVTNLLKRLESVKGNRNSSVDNIQKNLEEIVERYQEEVLVYLLAKKLFVLHGGPIVPNDIKNFYAGINSTLGKRVIPALTELKGYHYTRSRKIRQISQTEESEGQRILSLKIYSTSKEYLESLDSLHKSLKNEIQKLSQITRGTTEQKSILQRIEEIDNQIQDKLLQAGKTIKSYEQENL